MAEQEAVVRVRRSDWERVTERELLVGRLSLGSRLPQYLGGWCQLRLGGGRGRGGGGEGAYLTTAMLTGAVVLARYTLVSAMLGGVWWSGQ